jgi:hypothetical protein
VAEKNKFKAELYIFLQKKLKECLTEAITSHAGDLPVEIVSQFESIEHNKAQLVESSFSESAQAKHRRLAEEFDTITDVENTEREFVNQLTFDMNNADKWYEFVLFSLKYRMQAKAEQYLQKVI